MRSCRSRDLIVIPMPAGGYTVSFLKNNSSLNKAVAYIVPIQHNLTLKEVENEDDVGHLYPQEMCCRCNSAVPLHLLQSHLQNCNSSIGTMGTDSSRTTIQQQSTWSMRICLLQNHQLLFNCRQAEPVKTWQVPKGLTAAGFVAYLKSVYPQMERRTFQFCKVNRHRVLISLEEKTPEQLRSSGVLGRSALYIRPETSDEDEGMLVSLLN
ncbi:uncharacterized protein LOC132472164 isoform X2 [Gadus macrocephalus]|uniref:uncharacterized protein LOC132472164 isoform X2 n=1 Tax=Gadus macrocephalus TaxID=80720 RepID=UPI0028CB14F0|nr:uncharacterized protein LOC132472164 isoform X2 [Gadus macrocephalus]